MAETEVALRVTETGADTVGRSLDTLASRGATAAQSLEFKFQRLSATLSGLSQIARLAGGEFNTLSSALSDIAGKTALGAQLGSVAGPKGAAVGAGIGLTTGLIQQLIEAIKGKPEDKKPVEVQNNLNMNIGISGASRDEIVEALKKETTKALDKVKPFGFSLEDDINSVTRVQSRISRQ